MLPTQVSVIPGDRKHCVFEQKADVLKAGGHVRAVITADSLQELLKSSYTLVMAYLRAPPMAEELVEVWTWVIHGLWEMRRRCKCNCRPNKFENFKERHHQIEFTKSPTHLSPVPRHFFYLSFFYFIFSENPKHNLWSFGADAGGGGGGGEGVGEGDGSVDTAVCKSRDRGEKRTQSVAGMLV